MTDRDYANLVINMASAIAACHPAPIDASQWQVILNSAQAAAGVAVERAP